MGYRLIQNEALSRGFRRIAHDEIDAAVSHLAIRELAKRYHAVHEARKSIKKLRGLFRMLLPVLGPAVRTDIAALGELGRSLSEFRDAAALIESVDLIAQLSPGDEILEQLSSLRRGLRRNAELTCGRADFTTALEHGTVGLRRIKRRVAGWKPGEGFETVAPGLERTYRKGREALKRARREPTGENFHILRKRVKDRWYQTRILEGLWPNPALAPEKALRDLQENLGDDHNLEVLRALVPAESTRLLGLIGEFQRDLRERSLRSAGPLYDAKPAVFALGLGELWRQWRPEPMAPARARARAAAVAIA